MLRSGFDPSAWMGWYGSEFGLSAYGMLMAMVIGATV